MLVAHRGEHVDEVYLHAQRLLRLWILFLLILRLPLLTLLCRLIARALGIPDSLRGGARGRKSRAAEREAEGEPGSDNTRREGGQTHCILSLRANSVGRFRLIRCTVRAVGCLARIA